MLFVSFLEIFFWKVLLNFPTLAFERGRRRRNRRTACWIVTHILIWIVVFMVNVMKLCKAEFKFIIHHYLNSEIVFTWGNWSCWLSPNRHEETTILTVPAVLELWQRNYLVFTLQLILIYPREWCIVDEDTASASPRVLIWQCSRDHLHFHRLSLTMG